MFVYKITNKLNGKAYVGITSRTVEERFKEHAYKGYVLHQAVAKYGEENFTVETLAEAFDENEMKWLEQMFIQKLGTLVPNGYNLTLGGEGMLGYKFSDEAKQKMSKAKNKPIICIETGVEFPSITQCAKEMGLHRTGVSKVLTGKRKTHGGYTFAYKEELQ